VMTKVGASVVAVAVLAAVFGPLLVPIDPSAQQLALRLEGPSLAHWFGLDELGRDILTRVLSGARISLLVSMIVVSVSAAAGILIGSIAGYFGGWSTKRSVGSSTSCWHSLVCSSRLLWLPCSARALPMLSSRCH
jgi:peptide/nickel transport system permease protein